MTVETVHPEPPRERLRAVTFDLGDTLWHFPAPPPREAIEQHFITRVRHLLLAWGLQAAVPFDELLRRMRSTRSEAERVADSGDFRSPDYVALTDAVCREAGIELTPWQAAELWQAQNTGGDFLGRCLYEDTLAILEWLKGRGLAIAALTNRSHGGAMFLEELRQDGLLPYFDAIISSDQVGYRKPHPEIFRIALAALAVEPRRAAHVGDRIDVDVAGARRAGLVAIWMRHVGQAAPPPADPGELPHATIERLGELRSLDWF